MTSIALLECPPLAAAPIQLETTAFAQRYPELEFFLRGKPLLARRLRVHYQKVQEFCTRHLEPAVLEIELKQMADPQYFPLELMQKACDYQLFSMPFPTLLGGPGEHIMASFITYELVASFCVGVANLLGVSGLAIGCVLSTFDPRAVAKIAKVVVEKERQRQPVFLSTCVTEPTAGSDAEDADEFSNAKLYTSAKKVTGGYILNGHKVFISNGAFAAIHVVTAYRADGAHRPEDLMVLLVDANSNGIIIPRNEKKMGQRICPASEVIFDNVFVPDDMVCRTGDNGHYFAYAGIANVLGLTRAGVGGFATGVAENAYKIALTYCTTHDFLGQPMAQQQWIRLELAHLARRAQVCRSTYLGALLAVCSHGVAEPLTRIPDFKIFGWLMNGSLGGKIRDAAFNADWANWAFKAYARRQSEKMRNIVTAYSDVAKVSCTEIALENCQKAISLMGKSGLRHEHGAEKLLRDIKLLQIYEGTNQVNMLDFIKRRMG